MSFDANGWRKGATRKESGNRYTTLNSRELIVMHYTAGYEAESAINHFLQTNSSQRASVHFVVDVDGSVTQMVATSHCAWHAGHGVYQGRPRVNEFSIGIEIVNPGYHYRRRDGGFLNWEKKPVANERLARFGECIEARDPWVGSAPVWWPDFPQAQLAAVEDLASDLIATYSSIRDIVGHRDVDINRKLKVDPGPAFPLRRFRMLLDSRVDDSTATLMRVSTSGGSLNVRSGPGTEFATLAWGPLPNGSVVEVIETSTEWSRISVTQFGQAQQGWVASRYLSRA